MVTSVTKKYVEILMHSDSAYYSAPFFFSVSPENHRVYHTDIKLVHK